MKISYENADLSNVDKIWIMFNKLDSQTKFMMFEAKERLEKSKIENLSLKIKNSILQDDFFLIAKYEDNPIGFITAEKGKFNKIAHTAYIVVGILEDFRQIGIGTEFLKYLDIWARKNKIIRLELTVVCKNETAKKLYEKNGFKIEGIRQKSMLIDNEYIDEYYMAKILI